jgi:hypothetical protein
MADFKTKYPSTSSTALTITLASLASSSTRLVGRESTAVDNTTNVDLDHLLAGRLRVGASTLTANKAIEVWVYAPVKMTTGTPTYPDVLDGTDSDETFANDGQKASALRLAATIYPATTSGIDYYIAPVSVAALFGGIMPPFWGIFVTHDTAVALDSTGSNHYFEYYRIQNQSV